ncbi:tRNA (Thr-GGU) A37 N-methylase [Halorhabdus sp. SVX81]|uniref:tRNA (N6-threonylcarbamoyladenosine(37)-N6)-methyltransferase TrmO n=1 Tax=Halorhabdus sp. SVX81 TaxID=2978283 RepID=UPI0023DABAD8|nr:tRNA (N6-threonylcarbamoyladenosine(37)-N6)-methyltransferase TrmO [Halorhabdus sp. SVX81]WEL16774.1 tRNA (Thr-GGU) A37 N-methylase [Halorhabdus sp. SVX81]
MTDESITYEPIGTIHSAFESAVEMPIQPAGSDACGTVELEEDYAAGLADLGSFSHCILLYHFHESPADAPLSVEPFLDDQPRGLFATRAPRRPNNVGLSVVRIEAVDGPTIEVSGIDVVDGTPLLDVKPLVGRFDVPDRVDDSWIPASDDAVEQRRADDRFR